MCVPDEPRPDGHDVRASSTAAEPSSSPLSHGEASDRVGGSRGNKPPSGNGLTHHDAPAEDRAGFGIGPAPSPDGVTQLLVEIRAGDPTAHGRLFTLLYRELRDLACAQFGRPRSGQTLNPTALVHEAFMKLARPGQAGWNDREHFFAVAARAMRQILVDHARRKRAKKRTDNGEDDPYDHMLADFERRAVDVIAVSDALERLSVRDPLLARLVDLHFFACQPLGECALTLGISERSASRYWATARAWLRRELEK